MTDPTRDRAVIAFAADRSFLEPLAVAIRSLSHHYRGAVAVVTRDIVGSDRQLIQRAAGDLAVQWLVPPSDIVERFPGGHLAGSTYYRILLPDLLPDADRIVYLDGDVLVRRPVDDLVDVDLRGHALGAVRNLRAPWLSHLDGLRAWHHEQLDPTLSYFNAGVLVIDAATWRDRDLATTVLELAIRLAGLGLLGQMDQDALNTVFAGAWAELDYGWNQHPLAFETSGNHHLLLADTELTALREDPAVVHFIGRSKPWQALCSHPFADEWRTTARSVLGSEWTPEVRSLRTKVTDRVARAWHALVSS